MRLFVAVGKGFFKLGDSFLPVSYTHLTDDTVLVERMGLPVKVIEGAYENIKITTPEDIIFAETFVALGYGDFRR